MILNNLRAGSSLLIIIIPIIIIIIIIITVYSYSKYTMQRAVQ